MNVNRQRWLSWVVCGIGLAFIAFGAVSLLQQSSQIQSDAVILPPELDSLGAVEVSVIGDTSDNHEQVKLASLDTSTDASISTAPKPKAAPQSAAPADQPAQEAATAAPAATAIPTVDVTAAAQQYLNIYPVPDRLWIDRLKVNAKIQPVGPGKQIGSNAVEWAAPKNRNVGWHDYSGKFGEGRNIVLNGHNNIYGAVFRKLYTLKAGDEIRLGAGDKIVTYQVEQVLNLREKGQPLEVRIQNAEYIQPMNDDRLTLISCWPETSNTHRVIVIARPVVR